MYGVDYWALGNTDHHVHTAVTAKTPGFVSSRIIKIPLTNQKTNYVNPSSPMDAWRLGGL